MVKRNIFIQAMDRLPLEKQPLEFVERKGVGHPDSIADALAEEVSKALCKYYLKEIGWIMHHNTDECQIVGGHSAPKFGGGVVLEPAYILLIGRVTSKIGDKRLPVRAIAIKSVADYLRKNFETLDVDKDVMIDCKIGEGSQELKEVYDSRRKLANDTSFGAGFAPLTEMEKLTLETEKLINGKLKKEFPEVGKDVKVMSYRNKDQIKITIAAAMIDRFLPDADHYLSVKEELANRLHDHALNYTEKEVKVEVNTADDLEKGIYYLTVTGLSIENGDDGSAGRGNRINGLITPYRLMSLEAPCGKNPVTHIGKLYQVLASIAAQEIYKEFEGLVEEVYVHLLGQIGKPIDQPLSCSVQLVPTPRFKLKKVKSEIEAMLNEKLENIYQLTEPIVNGKINLF
jgi:S-adenosylmethionine synthetase